MPDNNQTDPDPQGANIAVGAGHYIAVVANMRQGDGIVLFGGRNDYGQLGIPEDFAGIAAIGAGKEHTILVDDSGIVNCFGNNEYGQCSPPTALTDVVSVDGGSGHSLALRADGTVVGWGDNYNGQAQPPEGLTGVTAIAAGHTHSLALRKDGSLVEWPPTQESDDTKMPEGITAVGIAAGVGYSMAIDDTGKVWCWGDDSWNGGWNPDVEYRHWVEWGWETEAREPWMPWCEETPTVDDDGSELGGGRTHPPDDLSDLNAAVGVKQLCAGGNRSIVLLGDGGMVHWGWPGYLHDDWHTPTALDQYMGIKGIPITCMATYDNYRVAVLARPANTDSSDDSLNLPTLAVVTFPPGEDLPRFTTM